MDELHRVASKFLGECCCVRRIAGYNCDLWRPTLESIGILRCRSFFGSHSLILWHCPISKRLRVQHRSVFMDKLHRITAKRCCVYSRISCIACHSRNLRRPPRKGISILCICFFDWVFWRRRHRSRRESLGFQDRAVRINKCDGIGGLFMVGPFIQGDIVIEDGSALGVRRQRVFFIRSRIGFAIMQFGGCDGNVDLIDRCPALCCLLCCRGSARSACQNKTASAFTAHNICSAGSRIDRSGGFKRSIHVNFRIDKIRRASLGRCSVYCRVPYNHQLRAVCCIWPPFGLVVNIQRFAARNLKDGSLIDFNLHPRKDRHILADLCRTGFEPDGKIAVQRKHKIACTHRPDHRKSGNGKC